MLSHGLIYQCLESTDCACFIACVQIGYGSIHLRQQAGLRAIYWEDQSLCPAILTAKMPRILGGCEQRIFLKMIFPRYLCGWREVSRPVKFPFRFLKRLTDEQVASTTIEAGFRMQFHCGI